MSECVVCNLCSNPGTFSEAHETAKVPACVQFFKEESFTVWRCTNCGSIHSKEEVDLVRFYDKYPFKFHTLDYHTRVAYRNRIKMLRQRGVREDSTILDYGCGSGIFIDFMKSQGFKRVSGYDAFIPRFADPSILDQPHDVVTSYDVIEHVDAPREYLENLVRPLKDGGLLVLGTPNANYVKLAATPYFPVELSQPYHRHIFSEEALFGMCAEYGLIPESIYRRFYFDSLYPAVNTRFMWEYINQNGSVLDVCVKPINWSQVLVSPKLLFYAVAGYFLPEHGNILVSFRLRSQSL